MDTFMHNAKRKKRKTRKCLDEIRKRSRNGPSHSLSKNIKSTMQNTTSYKKANHCITSDRLTLNMFAAKTVRSETVTRSLYSSREQELEPKQKSTANAIVVTNNIGNTSLGRNDNSEISFIESDFVNNEHDEKINSSDGSVFISPIQENYSLANNESSLGSTTVRSSFGRSNEDPIYSLYEELMDNIPVYIKKHFTNLMREDVIKRSRICLQNMYVVNYQQDSDINLMQCFTQGITSSDISHGTEDAIVQNPMDYIKLTSRSVHPTCHSQSNECSLSCESTSNSLSDESPQNIHTALSCTPDYDFYPHKLNE